MLALTQNPYKNVYDVLSAASTKVNFQSCITLRSRYWNDSKSEMSSNHQGLECPSYKT